MAIFDRWKKKRDRQEPGRTPPASQEPVRAQEPPEWAAFDPEPSLPEEIVSPYFDRLSACIGPARQHQLAFGELVVLGRNWSVDFEQGLIWFGEASYPIQLLGTESESAGTWLWGFANPGGVPETVLEDVTRFHREAVAQGMEELAGDRLKVTPLVGGHNIASLAAISHPQPMCYYRCPYEGGAAYVLVGGLPDTVFAPVNAQKTAALITEIIRLIPVDYRQLTASLLEKNCRTVEKSSLSVTGIFEGGESIAAEFDDENRLTRLNVEGAAEAEA